MKKNAFVTILMLLTIFFVLPVYADAPSNQVPVKLNNSVLKEPTYTPKDLQPSLEKTGYSWCGGATLSFPASESFAMVHYNIHRATFSRDPLCSSYEGEEAINCYYSLKNVFDLLHGVSDIASCSAFSSSISSDTDLKYLPQVRSLLCSCIPDFNIWSAKH